VILLACLGLALVLLKRSAPDAGTETAAADAPPPESRPNALSMVLGSQFLRLIAIMTLLLNLVNSNNEWILDKLVSGQDMAEADVRSFYGSFYLLQNIITVVIQAFITRRIQERYGARVALFFLPLVGIIGGAFFLVVPSLFVIRWSKVLENSTDYSIQSNTRELLYLPTTKVEKYAAKNVNETFVVRIGDALAAGSIAVAVSALIPAMGESLGLKTLVGINLALGVIWLLVVNRLGKLHKERMEGVEQRS
jgi:ATP:ADP antiporter, AAA family